MLIKIKHDPSITVTGNRPAQAASSMKRQRQYLRLARNAKGAEQRFMMRLWHQERTFWAHYMGLTDGR